MTNQEYKFIRNLAWDLLIDSNATSLPINIQAIAKLYDLEHLIDNNKSLYENTLLISDNILNIFGLNRKDFSKYLAVRILTPMIIFKELNIKSSQELSDLSGLPMDIASQRYDRFIMLQRRNSFELSRLESIVLSQFKEWITNQIN